MSKNTDDAANMQANAEKTAEVPAVDASPQVTVTKPKRGAASSGKERGAYFSPVHAERIVKVYPILETEMKSLGLLNTLATTLFSIGTGLLTFCVGLHFDISIESGPTTAARNEVHLAYAICITLGVLALIGASVAACYRHSELAKILSESQGKKT